MNAGQPQFPKDLIELLRGASRIAALTGAGVSAESGIPTFRDAQIGLWARYRPEDLATPEAFQRNPSLVWDWYAWRRGLVAEAQPNPAHKALARIEKQVPAFTLITQNVDGLHRRTGSEKVLELHGSLQRVKCFAEGTPVAAWDESEHPPRCPNCGAWLRPDVVWFGESLPQKIMQAADQAARTCEVFFSIGTSSIVEPAASLPWIALRQGAAVIEINPNPTPLTSAATMALQGKAGELLPALAEAVWLE